MKNALFLRYRLPLCLTPLLTATLLSFVTVTPPVSAFAADFPNDPPVALQQAGRAASDASSASSKAVFLPDLLADLNTLAVEQDDRLSLGTRVLIVQAQAKAGDMKAASKSLATALVWANAVPDDPRTFFSRHDALRVFAWAQAQTGDTQGATETLIQAKTFADKIQDNDFKVRAFIAIAEVQAEVGDRGGARETIVQAKQMVTGMDSSYPFSKAVASSEIAVAQGHIGDIAEAKETALAVSDAFQKGYALECIATVQAQKEGASNGREAKATFLLVKQAANAIEASDEHRPLLLALVALAQARSGDRESASESLSQAEQANALIRFTGDTAVPTIIQTKTELGDISGAERMVALVRSGTGTKTDVLRLLTDAYAKAGQWDKALGTAGKGIGSSREHGLTVVAQAQARAGQMNEARAMIKTMAYGDDQIKSLCGILMEVVAEKKMVKAVKANTQGKISR